MGKKKRSVDVIICTAMTSIFLKFLLALHMWIPATCKGGCRPNIHCEPKYYFGKVVWYLLVAAVDK